MEKINQGKKDIVVTPKPATSVASTISPTVWLTASFAQKWFEDAKLEARHQGIDARRREILFAVCCAESYLLEWVRGTWSDQMLHMWEEILPHLNATAYSYLRSGNFNACKRF